MPDIGVSSLASALASHAAARQELVARNIANADTPDYRATDLAPFAEQLDGPAMKATRDGHLDVDTSTTRAETVERPGQPSPNGNTVSLEMEMMQAAGIRQQHDMALSVYTATRDILSTALGRGR
ncbi:FlgB family protein [Palleronia rufa]|uniref:FlgB family protein n=1 Tax=Palleronia rufa TaxID=1530186 RepID=UPI000562C33C|nr:FlgB family protein [Palleronia rufa]